MKTACIGLIIKSLNLQLYINSIWLTPNAYSLSPAYLPYQCFSMLIISPGIPLACVIMYFQVNPNIRVKVKFEKNSEKLLASTTYT